MQQFKTPQQVAGHFCVIWKPWNRILSHMRNIHAKRKDVITARQGGNLEKRRYQSVSSQTSLWEQVSIISLFSQINDLLLDYPDTPHT
jgi:hypothetical protein